MYDVECPDSRNCSEGHIVYKCIYVFIKINLWISTLLINMSTSVCVSVRLSLSAGEEPFKVKVVF